MEVRENNTCRGERRGGGEREGGRKTERERKEELSSVQAMEESTHVYSYHGN